MRWRRLWLLVVLLALISRAGADTIDDLAAEISEDQLRAHLTALPAPRDTVEAQAAAADYIVSELQSYGYTVTRDPVLQSANVIVHIPGERYPERTFVVGAHFDSDQGCPGADDNGAAVAGILEMARVLAVQRLTASLDLVAFAAEEAGLVGSRQYADEAREDLREISGMLSLEMIAYTCTQPGCQFVFPNIRGCLQIDHPMPNVGTFIAGIGNDASHDLLQTFQAAAARYVPQLSVDTGQVAALGSCLPDTRRSDHASFWFQDYPALMITDTANYRNPNYHEPSDTLETLDLTFATQVTQAALATALRVAGLASDPVPTPTATRARTPLPTKAPIPADAHVLLYTGAIIDTADQRVVGTMPVLGNIAAAQDGRSLYVSSGAISVVDTATNLVTSTIPVEGAGRIALAPDGRLAYVASYASASHTWSIVVVDMVNRSTVAAIPTQATSLAGPSVSPDGQFVYLADRNRSSVSVIATASNSIVASFPVGESFPAFGPNYPSDIVFTPDATTAYVTNEQSATVSVIDTGSNTMTKNILVHQNPGSIVMTPDGTKAYVDMRGFYHIDPHRLDVIDTGLNRVTDTIDLPATSSGLAMTPDGRLLYVSSCPHIFVVDTATDTIADILFIEPCFTPMAIAAVANLPPLTPYPTLTPSPTGVSVTPSPTATPTVPPCTGDCNGNDSVTVDEILIMVDVALGSDEVSECFAGDANNDGQITVEEILVAVNNALNTCHPLPTATPTPTFGGCGNVCDGRTCISPMMGNVGTCIGVSDQGCDCVPYSAGGTPTQFTSQ
jgi:YVTN family beta-propeller protein